MNKFLQLAGVMAASIGITACGGSGSSDVSSSSSVEQTKLAVGLTDAEGDFVSYRVDVDSILLTRANGASIEVVPRTTSVDFVEYVEVTELLTMVDVPSGRYTGASMVLDFSQSDIQVHTEEGEAVSATPVDNEGATITTITVDMSFGESDTFTLRPGVPAVMTLDFDLDASNEIVFSDSDVEVVVSPVLLVDAVREDPKPFRLRGLLDDVSAEDGSFELDIKPFKIRSGVFGAVDVMVDSDTEYEIDGEPYSSDLGLAELAEKENGTAVVTYGSWDSSVSAYVADTVFAGSSVPWDQADLLRGSVVARTGNTLEVKGARVDLAEGSYVFNDTFTVVLDESTSVNKYREGEAGIEDISVGSRIVAVGDYTESQFDATAGIVRIMPTGVTGRVVSVSPLVVDASLLNARRPSVFDFSGTGTSDETDADPENYEIDTSSLSLSTLEVNDPVRIKGFVSDFGSAPEDLHAVTVIDRSLIRAHMVMGFGLTGSDSALDYADDSVLQFSHDPLTLRHHVVIGARAINMNALDATPAIIPGDEEGVYSLKVNRSLEVYSSYDAFITAYTNYVAEGATTMRVDARGYYDVTANTLTSRRVGVVIVTD